MPLEALGALNDIAYGWRARIGFIVPPTNTVNEAEWQRMAPDGVSTHATRIPLHTDTASATGKAALYADIERASGDLVQAGVGVVAYACTAGSMVTPVAQLGDYMTEQTGVPAVTTAAALIAALRTLEIERLAVATPYHDALNAHEAAFLGEHGIETVAIKGLGIGAGGAEEFKRISRTPVSEVYKHALSVDRPEAQALFISCTDFPTLDIVARLESELGKPVITSNQATFWACLRTVGLDDRFNDFGTLLKVH